MKKVQFTKSSLIIPAKPYLPMAYAIDKDSVAMERKNRGSAKRESVGFLPHIWGQSLYILSRLLVEDFVSPGELDPLNRRMAMQKRPEVIVQESSLQNISRNIQRKKTKDDKLDGRCHSWHSTI